MGLIDWIIYGVLALAAWTTYKVGSILLDVHKDMMGDRKLKEKK